MYMGIPESINAYGTTHNENWSYRLRERKSHEQQCDSKVLG